MKTFLNRFAELLKTQIEPWGLDDIIDTIEIPEPSRGDFAFPCFKLARIFRKAPPMIAKEIQASLDHDTSIFEKIEVAGPYLNAFINPTALQSYFKEQLTDNQFIKPRPNCSKSMCIDYSSPNIAKPIAFHHIRSTVIGNSIANLFEFLGYSVARINYLGDWGTQFGKLIVAFKNWGDNDKLETQGIQHLLDIYIKFHEEAEKDPTMDQEARDWFKKTEDQDPEALTYWNRFKEISIKEFKRIYKLLGVSFTHFEGESIYADRLDSTVDLIQSKVKTEISRGALIVPLEEYDMPPCLLKKMDGATLYATRDIAAAMDRHDRFQFDQSLYAVGNQQQLHFRQVFKVIEKMGFPWFKNMHHIQFGMVKGMSTRGGNLVFLEDVLKEAISRAKEKIAEKERVSEQDIDDVSRKIGVGAIIFGDLKNSRINDFEFNWEDLLNFSGYTGPSVQYAYTRIQSIFRKSEIKDFSDGDFSLLVDPLELQLMKLILTFDQVLEKAFNNHELYFVARFAYDLTKEFAKFHKEINVIRSEKPLQKARLLLLDKVSTTLKTALSILGVETVDYM